MAETGQLAAWVGREKGFEFREYPVPDPAPGAALINGAFRCGTPWLLGGPRPIPASDK